MLSISVISTWLTYQKHLNFFLTEFKPLKTCLNAYIFRLLPRTKVQDPEGQQEEEGTAPLEIPESMRNIRRARNICFTISTFFFSFFFPLICCALFSNLSMPAALLVADLIFLYFHVPGYAPCFSLSCIWYLFSLFSSLVPSCLL